MRALVFFVATILVASQCHGSRYQTFPLQMRSTGYDAQYSNEVKCASRRLAVEAHNLIGFETIPEYCEEPTANYLHNGQYQSDSKFVNQQAYFYAKTLTVRDNDIWVFSIDGTLLSNIPYYSENGYGTEVFNSTLYDEWVLRGEATTLPETIKNYNKLLSLGFKIVLISGRTEDKREVTVANLKAAGYDSWHKLILKDPETYNGKNALAYKTAERGKLVKSGYRIIGNIGDQWTDLLGSHKGLRSFKLPNPMYYIE